MTGVASRLRSRGNRENDCRMNAYARAALIVLNTLVGLIAINVILAGAFVVKDWRTASASAKPSADLFQPDGSPTPSPKRLWYQLSWFDRKAYGDVIPDQHIAAVLDDFFDLSTKGFIYQPWVQFSE